MNSGQPPTQPHPSGAWPHRPPGPWQVPPPSPPSQRNEALLQMLMIVGVVVVLSVAAMVVYASTRDGGAPEYTSSTGGDGRVAASSEVLYEVEGTASTVFITIEAPGGTQQRAGQAVPLMTQTGERGLTFFLEAGSFLYISAQNEGAKGSVTCRITVDGVVVSENTSGGGYTIATCKGSA